MMNERAALNPAKWFPAWTIIISLLSAALRVGSVPFNKRIFGALRIVVTPRTMGRLSSAARIDLLAGPHCALGGGAKRAMDIVLSVLALIVLSPLLAAVAVALRLESPSAPIIREMRFGPGSRPIQAFKFRSMRLMDRAAAGDYDIQSSLTPLGRVLRQFGLEELPQLGNVLRGEMSLVGPRSQLLQMRMGEEHGFDAGERYYAQRFVKPGITGWAQINGSGRAANTIGKAQRLVDLDLWYLEHWSIWLDIEIIVWTARNGFRSESVE